MSRKRKGGGFLFFPGFATAYERHQNPLILREARLVAFFLSGLVVLDGLLQWWLEPLLMGMDANAVFFGATALTYLGSLVEGLSLDFKIALVAGAVTGGGVTLIANAQNPAGAAILKGASLPTVPSTPWDCWLPRCRLRLWPSWRSGCFESLDHDSHIFRSSFQSKSLPASGFGPGKGLHLIRITQ